MTTTNYSVLNPPKKESISPVPGTKKCIQCVGKSFECKVPLKMKAEKKKWARFWLFFFFFFVVTQKSSTHYTFRNWHVF